MKQIDGIYGQLKTALWKPENKKRLVWSTIIFAMVGVIFFMLISFTPLFKIQATVSPENNAGIGKPVVIAADTEPRFTINSNGLISATEKKTAQGELDIKQGTIKTKLSFAGEKVDLKTEIATTANKNTFSVKVPLSPQFKPGKYQLEIELASLRKTQTLTQDFTWGVLAMNVRRSYEKTNTETQIGMSVLNNNGQTQCDAKVLLDIADPYGKIQRFSTADKTVIIDPNCVDRGVTNNPDYAATYQTAAEGIYTMTMTATIADGTRSFVDTFQVKDDVAFDVARTAFPTRIYPVPKYPVSFTITTNEDYAGKVVETVPNSFEISKISDRGTAKKTGDNQQITWDVTWQKGETYTLGYTIHFPMVTPEWYLLGPLKIGSFQEARQWQIASDAYGCTLTLSASVAWTAAAWGSCGVGGSPGLSNTGDTATITGATGTSYVLTIGASLNYSIASITLSGGTRNNTILFGGAYTVNVTDSPGTISITGPGGNYTSQISVADGTLTASGLVTISSGSSGSRIGLLTTSSGKIYANGGITFGASTTLAGQRLTTTGAGFIYLTGNLSYNGTVSVAATSTFTMNGSGTLSNGGTTAYSFGKFTIASGTTTLNADITVADFTNNSGTSALAGAHTVTIFATTPSAIGGTYATTFDALSIQGGVVTANISFTVNNNLAIATSTYATRFILGSSSVTATLNTVTHNQLTGGVSSTEFDLNQGTANVSGTYTLAGTNNTAGYVNTIKFTIGGTLNLNGATSLSFGATTTVANHVIDASSGFGGNINIAGSIVNSINATTAPGTASTWTFNGTAAQTIPMGTSGGTYWGACTTQCYANLTITNTAGATLGNAVASGNIAGNLTVGNDSTLAIFNNGGYAIVGATNKWLTVHGNGTFNMTGTSTYPTGFTGTGGFLYDATSTVNYKQTNAPTITNATYGNLGVMPAATGAAIIFPATLNTIAGNLTIGDGTNLGGTALDNDPTIVVTGNMTIAAGATFVASDANTMTVNGNWLNSGTFNPSNQTVIFNSASTRTINSGGTGTNYLFNNLTHSGAGTLQLVTNAIDINGIFTNSNGTFDANGLNMNVADDFLASGGSFSAGATPGTQTVTFDSTTTATVSGSTTFNNLTMNTTADGAKEIDFTAGTTQTINGTWNLSGAVGKVLTIKSTSDTNAWKFVIPANMNSGDYINVRDSQNTTNAYRITADVNCTDSGNNVPGWLFGGNYTFTSLTTDQNDYPTLGLTITVDARVDNGTGSNKIGTYLDYVIFIDGNSNHVPDAGETYITSACAGSAAWASGNYTFQKTGLDVLAHSYATDQQSCTNTNFPSTTTYTLWSKWWDGVSTTYATKYVTFSSVPTLTEFLFLILVGLGIFWAYRSGRLKLWFKSKTKPQKQSGGFRFEQEVHIKRKFMDSLSEKKRGPPRE